MYRYYGSSNRLGLNVSHWTEGSKNILDFHNQILFLKVVYYKSSLLSLDNHFITHTMTHHAASQDDLSIGALFSFKDHVVLVTGGATGLGEMAAQGFVQNGARVIIASRKESELKKVSGKFISRRAWRHDGE